MEDIAKKLTLKKTLELRVNQRKRKVFNEKCKLY